MSFIYTQNKGQAPFQMLALSFFTLEAFLLVEYPLVEHHPLVRLQMQAVHHLQRIRPHQVPRQ
jgi:hypothetical protein